MTATRHNLYEWTAGLAYRSQYAYASGYTPLPDRKSFVPPARAAHHRRFTEINGHKPGIQISGEGSKWPDFLVNGGGYVQFFVSERVIRDLDEAGVEILDATEFPIESIEASRTRLKIEDAPRYFVLEAHPEMVPDWAAMRVPIGPDGRPQTPYPPRSSLEPFLYRKDTWSGRDLVSSVNATTRLFSSERLKEYGEARKWTNASFERIGSHTIRAANG